jgi:predicted MFS family arabinose efflux permease
MLDSTIVNVALPSIQIELGFSASALAWVVNAYMICYGALLLPSGRLADRFGHAQVFFLGILLFTAASVGCGVAQTPGVLIAARGVQGVGAAAVMATSLSLVVQQFSSRALRAQALGIYSFVGAGAGSAGVLLSGVLTSLVHWRLVFLINLPIGLAICGFCRLIPRHDSAVTTHGRLEIIPRVVLRNYDLRIGALIGALWAGSQATWIFFSTLYLQFILGYNAFTAGLAFLPATVTIAAFSLGLSKRLILWVGGRLPLRAGLVLLTAGLALLALHSTNHGFVGGVLPSMLLVGVGCGVAYNAFLLLALQDVAEESQGVASGALNSATVIGAAVTLTLLAKLAAVRTTQLISAGESDSSALIGGYQWAFAVGAGLAALATLLAMTSVRAK